MIVFTKPRIISLDERKIHVSRKPGFIVLSLFSLSAVIFIEMCLSLTKNLFYRIILFLGQIMFCLDVFGECQDLLLDKDKNNAVIKKYTWIDKLCLNTGRSLCIAMKLSDVQYVGISIEMGLFILCKNGKTISLSMQGFTWKELQSLRRKINYFLYNPASRDI
ncbi:uncharacterized protein LOC143209329 [Lasioglossum baleicum]|uniref:uncharacterized protein LOC143209329 n=1 Tax=Lasioglossum baleicum TaxID=434251 RepID=UPI003FCC431A